MVWPFSRQIHRMGGSLLFSDGQGWRSWKNAREAVEKGYQGNAVVYAAIQEVATAVASLEFEIVEVRGDGEVQKAEGKDADTIRRLLEKPNPMMGSDGFIKALFVDYHALGEMAIEGTPHGGKPVELWPVNPIDVSVKPGPYRVPKAYQIGQGEDARVFPYDPVRNRADLFFMKMYNPGNWWRGQSPLSAVAVQIDAHNAGSRWNYKLLKNGARPSGLVKFKDEPGAETLSLLREYFKKALQGEDNAGELPVLQGDAEWQELSQSPRDMDYVTTMREFAKHIARALGVPLPLIDNDAATFNNVESAKERFYLDTVIPRAEEFLSQFGTWLGAHYGDGKYQLRVDRDAIPALASIRQREFDRAVKGAGGKAILTQDDARKIVNHEAKGGSADSLDPVGDAIFGAASD
jgi:HK97 family phage portal protein